MKKTLHFKTNTLLKNLVGKDLINDDNIAIVELVKNSYDANSGKVLVRFDKFSSKGVSTISSQIIIADEGFGMDLKDIEDKWLNIAYSEKFLLEQEHGRYLAGNKGIGRFSCDRLGEGLDLLTRKNGGELLHLKIQWADFEIEGDKDLTIQEIPLDIVSIDEKTATKIAGIEKFPDAGTILVISSPRNEWDQDKLRKLKTSLEKFINPNQLFLRSQFLIELSVPSLLQEDKKKKYQNRINGPIQNQIFENLKFNSTYIEATISEDGRIITTTLHHEGEKVFDLVEKNTEYKLLQKTYLVVYYLNPYKKAYFKRQTGVRSVDFGSIFLFLNGFRVSPYGNRGDDWLGLDVRSAQGYARYLGTRNIIGRIEVGGNEEQFKPVSSREGLKNTVAFRQLRKEFYMDTHLKLEKFVVDGLSWDSVPQELRGKLSIDEGLDWASTNETYKQSWELKKQRIALSIMTLIGASPERTIKFWFSPSLLEDIYETRQQEVEKILEDIEEFGADKIDANLSKNLSEFKKVIKKKEEEAKIAKAEAADLRIEAIDKDEKITKLKKEKETYRKQTSFFEELTPLDVKDLITYLHQIKLDSNIAENFIARAIKLSRDIPNTQSLLNNLQKASLANKRMNALAQLATKADFLSGVKKVSTDIPSFVEQYLIYVAKDFVAAGLQLEVSNTVQEIFEINASRVELSILIDNIISNSSKARAKKISINISKVSDNTVRVSFIDDGRGLSEAISQIDTLFEMGITTTSGGSGLGLYQAKKIIDKIDGKIEAINLKPNGMEIRVEITR